MTKHTAAARPLRAAGALTAAAGLTALGLAPAAAHVTASSSSTAAEGYAQITFSVPTESDSASTTGVQLDLPAGTPFAAVRVQPVEGWSAQLTEEQLPEPVAVGEGAITEAVTTVTWTADAEHGIGPGEFQRFTVSVGPLPAEGTEILLPVTQTYSDGRAVAWDEPTTEGQGEPEHPAPSLTTTAAEGDEHHEGAQAAGQDGDTEAAGQDGDIEAAAATGSSTGSVPGWAGLVAGLLGLAAGTAALLRSRGHSR